MCESVWWCVLVVIMHNIWLFVILFDMSLNKNNLHDVQNVVLVATSSVSIVSIIYREDCDKFPRHTFCCSRSGLRLWKGFGMLRCRPFARSLGSQPLGRTASLQ